jgi:nucleotide-binding universal stress UspA family protein
VTVFRRILVPVDGTERAAAALGAALGLAQLGGGTIVGLHVAADAPLLATGDIGGPFYDAWRAEADRFGRDALDYVVRRATEAGVPCETVMAPPGPPWEGIIATARERGCDVIVMASHGHRGVAARLLGSETQRVLVHCDIPVLVVH